VVVGPLATNCWIARRPGTPTGDTLFPGGSGLSIAAWPLSHFPTIMATVERLITRPDATAVPPGHGPSTTIGAERDHVASWPGEPATGDPAAVEPSRTDSREQC
jgi:glyoxylase-like metal-dependent hydrolase (beta-lactamase superfamily II)